MQYIFRNILFDQRDHQLLRMMNNIQKADKTHDYFKRHFYSYFHPRGIQELAESRGMRIAYAVVYLLNSLEVGAMNERLNALRLLRDEVLNASESVLQRNTARVLVQIMKELVRAKGDYVRQFELAHDFRMATSGKPRVIRRLLRQYHLLEMPESWNQITFDDHVHDANTKGRKTSSHLIMDAWIKGIRKLRVIYYNYLEPRFVTELLESAKIMGITVRIGIEITTVFHGKNIQFIWVPRGFLDAQAFLCFLADSRTATFMKMGRQVSEFQKKSILELLDIFNQKHRHQLNQEYHLQLEPISKKEFLDFVGIGQASRFHLAMLIDQKIQSALQTIETIQKDDPGSDENMDKLYQLCPETILDQYLDPEIKPNSIQLNDSTAQEDLPELLKIAPQEVIAHLIQLHSAYRITLNLKGLTAEDVLEFLYDCEGTVTRLEIFNLKNDAIEGSKHINDIVTLQKALNDGNVITLKRMIREMINKLKQDDPPTDDSLKQIKKLTSMLHDIDALKSMYQYTPLKARIGSDSIGRSKRIKGMGFAIIETLPRRAQKEIQEGKNKQRSVIPFRIETFKRTTYVPIKTHHSKLNRFFQKIRKDSIFATLTYKRSNDWVVHEYPTLASHGNIVTLGGIHKTSKPETKTSSSLEDRLRPKQSWRYLNTNIKNILKVMVGFVPAFATFALTNDWWVLAYLGAFIWFGITGVRNIIQSVLGGGGFKRSPLLRWNDYVSWERLTDSLLFTGFSVPLLDYIVKTLFLQNTLNITTANHPYALYSIMALANGLYLSSHNAFRGLPKGAIIGNFFRSILSIPLAIVYSAGAETLFGMVGMAHVDDVLQKSAAIISKAASDTIAGMIEGTADRYHNIKMRIADYQERLRQLFNVYSSLEMMFPEKQPLELLKDPEQVVKSHNSEALDLGKIILITALDMLYFWMYQPRARSTIRQLIASLSEEERIIFFKSQQILGWKKDISLLLVNGFVGQNFASALAFYLGRSNEYLDAVARMK
ncbi:MAG: hypothetical protein HQK75_13925 [Candidatus Magnetomorum sp.]|nr:hypothetical protein [Candidatus Magnetomorum sp.]